MVTFQPGRAMASLFSALSNAEITQAERHVTLAEQGAVLSFLRSRLNTTQANSQRLEYSANKRSRQPNSKASGSDFIVQLKLSITRLQLRIPGACCLRLSCSCFAQLVEDVR